jgi:hypothetical protein
MLQHALPLRALIAVGLDHPLHRIRAVRNRIPGNTTRDDLMLLMPAVIPLSCLASRFLSVTLSLATFRDELPRNRPPEPKPDPNHPTQSKQ